MAREAKKLSQTFLSAAGVTVASGKDGGRTQVTDIWLANTGTVERKVTVYAHGTNPVNTLIPTLSVPAGGGKIISSCKIVLASGEVLTMKQDAGADVTATAYGIEEA